MQNRGTKWCPLCSLTGLVNNGFSLLRRFQCFLSRQSIFILWNRLIASISNFPPIVSIAFFSFYFAISLVVSTPRLSIFFFFYSSFSGAFFHRDLIISAHFHFHIFTIILYFSFPFCSIFISSSLSPILHIFVSAVISSWFSVLSRIPLQFSLCFPSISSCSSRFCPLWLIFATICLPT